MSYSPKSTMKRCAIIRTESLFLVLDIFLSFCSLFSVLVLGLWSLSSEYPPSHRSYLLFLKSSFQSIDATSSFRFLTAHLDTHTFRFRLQSKLSRRFPGLYLSSFLHQPNRFGTFIFLGDYNHDLLICSPMMIFVQKCLFFFQIRKIKMVGAVEKIRIHTDWFIYL